MPAAEPKTKDHSLDITKTEPGFHVVCEGTYCGTYNSEDEAQGFIDGHVTPQGKEASIIEGPEATEAE